ncbi:sigma-70 family RNA polymerase sigma factor [Pedobacter riviphilus]|uniref:Sigma-70 family RNA polymerase sigma factor n=1 Tax=Pedobacter riviphilus TaxID=2766984 RepID=A0ABX6TIL1_9SPHI|nr:sigma-70 family RNA polymerase sigma factor [Pedobacter riviphilus]QNR84760.1 sigma-70 family RNA polymerase sigma factor [Pedobacter riviphilus]
MEHLSDLKSGNITAFQHLYALYNKKLYFFILKKSGSAYMAEEVVQLTFIRLWNKRKSIPLEVPAYTIISRMAYTILIDQIRKEAVNQKLLNKVEVNDQTDNITEYTNTLAAIEYVLELMAPMRKKVFKLSRFDGFSHKEIAEKLSISPKTVEYHVSKAIKQIKAVLSSFWIALIYILQK